MNNKIKPAKTYRYGNVCTSVWANESTSGVFYNATFTRSFKDKDGGIGYSQSFGDLDLPHLAKAVLDTHTWIVNNKAVNKDNECGS